MKKLLVILFLLFGVSAYGHSESFIQYMMEMENSIKAGYVNGRWYPHDVLGVPHVGYGHKIVEGEDFSNGLTDAEAKSLLIKDLSRAEKSAAKFLHKKYGVEWSELPVWKREVFIDFEFNGVLRSFPKFTRAVLSDDVAGMVREYKRYARTTDGKRIELKARNSGLYKRYIEPLRFISK